MDQPATLNEYFGVYLGASLFNLRVGQLRVVASERMTRPEKGWGYTFAIWALLMGDRGVVSVRPDLEPKMTRAIHQIRPVHWRPEAIVSALGHVCLGKLRTCHALINVCGDGDVKS